MSRLDTWNSARNMDINSVYSDEPMSSSLDGTDAEPTRDRLDHLEKLVHHQADEIVLLRSVIAELVRRVTELETTSRGSATSRERSFTSSNGTSGSSTLTLPTRSSTNRSSLGNSTSSALSTSRSTLTNKNAGHHLSSESLQSTGTARNSYGGGGGGIRASPSMDRLATPKSAVGSHTMGRSPANKATTPTTPMRKWTSNSDFQNGVNSNSLTYSMPSPANSHSSGYGQTTSGSSTSRRYGSQTQLNAPPSFTSTSSSSASQATYRSATQLPVSLAHKEPVFNPDDGYLHVTIRGKGMNFHVPTEYCMKQSLTMPNPPPNQQLKLEWAYGYRGRDVRGNLHCIATGECVYFVASVVVLANFQEDLQRHYLGHSDDIRCLAVHPNRLIIASGQTGIYDKKSDSKRRGAVSPTADQAFDISLDKVVHIRIWDAVSLQTLHVLGGHGEFEKGFSTLAFSKMDGGALLSVIDESQEHTLTLWDWQKGLTRGSRIAMTQCGPEAVFACEFHPAVPNLMITCGKSNIFFWTLDGSTFALSKVAGNFERVERPKYILCLCFSEAGDIITGDSSGNIISWGRAAGNRVRQIVNNAHPGGVFVLLSCDDGTLVSGGKDKRLLVWDQDLNKTGMEYELPDKYGTARSLAQSSTLQLLVGTNRNCLIQGHFHTGFNLVVQGHFDEIWALATHPNHHQFATASYDRYLTLWSASDKVPVWSMEMQDGIHSICFHPDGDLIAVATISGRWSVVDTLTKEIVSSQNVNEDTQDLLSCIKYSPDGRFIAVASVDRCIYMYQVLEGGSKCIKAGKLIGHSSAVLCLDWSVDSTYLRSNSDNFELIYWTPATLKVVANPATCRDVDWDSWNCILEFGVAGVWSETVQALSVDCTRSDLEEASQQTPSVLAVGDDGGKVKLFTFPAMSLKSQCHVYNGHSNHVSSVRFLHDDSRLLTAGGRDASVLQWDLVPASTSPVKI
ncbi:hypothetical protein RvY_14230 [Ramazzottius varieornatus]|uniref:HELP domain-containing protein n=1 Tax=Ramazzottius varieornatus TaxID=947166 RepID=A0A1D1VQM8_RAMVA|nr:hypothetical protein RvY_14230 [Ramazzottius varieornatus]